MFETPRCHRGIVTAPHHLAAQAGLDILKQGGTAVEAAVAVAAVLAVVYPHMTGLGGDGFWLLSDGSGPPVGIDGCGAAAAAATPALYRSAGHDTIPWRGPLAALTVAGTVAGWSGALAASAGWSERPLPLAAILEPAIHYAEAGFPVSRSQSELTAQHLASLAPQPGFAAAFLPGGKPPAEGDPMKLPVLAQTLRSLARDGLDGFYRGTLARRIAADLRAAGSPVAAADLAACAARRVAPLETRALGARLFNMPPPTQGLASLMILALFDRQGVAEGEGFAHLHGLVEATKQAFLVRDRAIGCPSAMTADPAGFLAPATLDALAARIDPARALPWPQPAEPGDTTWFGVIDGKGRAVSMIQSIYFEFGSGVVLEETGLTWQNRGAAFRLDGPDLRRLRPGALPFHTLNPAMAIFDDGRRMVYGTMGGEGQPQTQAAVFSRYAGFGMPLQRAVTAPRWLLGRTWGEDSVDLKIEAGFPAPVIAALRAAGHDLQEVPAHNLMMGHAGALVRHGNGLLEGATDPRSDGCVAAW